LTDAKFGVEVSKVVKVLAKTVFTAQHCQRFKESQGRQTVSRLQPAISSRIPQSEKQIPGISQPEKE
jgi:hypothetical protein